MSNRLRFGQAEISADERQLWINGAPAATGARAFDLLLTLVQRRDRAVSKAELLDLVWPGLVVEENNLSVQISGLRKLLGPAAIATVPGRGYQFALATADDVSAAPQVVGQTPPLPALPESMFGREDDLDALDRLLASHRLVTVLGAGGIGKTTLALAAARRRLHGSEPVAWVELATLADPALIAPTIAKVLDLPIGTGDPVASLVRSIAQLQVTLMLDNAEHLIDAVAALVQALREGAPGVRLLVTSQIPLKVDGEWLFRVDPLSVPPAGTPVEEALTYGALALFDERARAADRHFALDESNVNLAADVCRRLDGMALAIRLAAARVPLFGLAGLHARLAARLDLLRDGGRSAPSRQQTLRAAHDWSNGLLSPAEQTVFRRLGVFAGGFTLASATAVASDSGRDDWSVVESVAVLVERSLVMGDPRQEGRYRLLESARAYALECLDASGELAAMRRRHAERMFELMEQSIEDDYAGMADREWIAKYGFELDDLRTALAWSEALEPALSLALLGAGQELFLLLGLQPEASDHVARLLTLDNESQPAVTRARFRHLRMILDESGRVDFTNDIVEAYRDAGDPRGQYLALLQGIQIGKTSEEQRLAMLQDMARLVRPEWSRRLRYMQGVAAAFVAAKSDSLAEARVEFARSVLVAKELGRDQQHSRLLMLLAMVEATLGASIDSVTHVREGLAIARLRGASNLFVGLNFALFIEIEAGLLDDARLTVEQLVALLNRTHGYRFPSVAHDFAMYAAMCGRLRTAARLLGLAQPETQDEANGPLFRRMIKRLRRQLHDGLGESEVRRLMLEGSSLDHSQACELVLDESAD